MPLGFRRRGKALDTKLNRSSTPIYADSSDQLVDQQQMDTTALYLNQAMRYSRSDLVYMCINRVAELCAMQANKLKLFDSTSERDPLTNIPEEEISEHPFYDLWQQPNVWTDLFTFVETWAIMLQISGNVYWHLDDGSEPKRLGDWKIVDCEGVPTSLWFIRPDRMVPKAGTAEYIKWFQYEKEQNKIKFLPKSICHFKRYNPLKELEGLSPIEPANYASASDVAAQRSNWALFKNALRLSGFIQSDRDEIDPDQLALMQKEVDKQYTGDPEKAHKLMWLWSAFEYNEAGITPRDAEFVEGAKLNRSRIFGVFGVHPAIILSEDVNRANAEVGEYVTLKFTIEPILKRLAAGITKVLPYWTADKPKKAEQNLEAHFVGVVPSDDTSEATVTKLRADTLSLLVKALGADEGIEEAIRQGIISDKVDAANAVPVGVGGWMDRGEDPEERKKESNYP